jgi:hypothetical protein
MKTRQFVYAALGVTAGVALVCGALMLPGTDTATGQASMVSTSLGWVVPLVSLLVIVAMTMMLLSRDSKRPPLDPPASVPCPHCGRSVLSDWRLCPYCGTMIDRAAGVGEPGA